MPNRRIIFARVPRGLPVSEDFGADALAIPEPGPGQFLSRTLWVSLDPYLRNVMKNNPLYADRLKPGDFFSGETVAQVVRSQHPTDARRELRQGTGQGRRPRVTHRDG